MTLSEIVSPVRTAILLVDLQRDFLSPDGVLGKAGQDVTRMRKVIEPIKMLLDRARKLSIPILFTQFIDSYQYRNAPGKHMFEKKELTEDHLCCLEGSVGAEFFDIVPKKEDEIIVKRSYDSFDGTSLEKNLRERYIQTLIRPVAN